MKRVIFSVLFLVFTFFFLKHKDSTALSEYLVENYDLSTVQGRELASISKPLSPYKTKKCTKLKHTDGERLTFCVADFDGTTGGFYDSKKELMVVGSMDIYTIVHEITHATTLHFYKKGFSDISASQTQEKIAYNAENLLSQIMSFQQNINTADDLSQEEKVELGIEEEE